MSIKPSEFGVPTELFLSLLFWISVRVVNVITVDIRYNRRFKKKKSRPVWVRKFFTKKFNCLLSCQ